MIELFRYFSNSISSEICIEDIPNNFGILLVDQNLFALKHIAEWDRAGQKSPAFHAVLIAPAHFCGEAFTLFLRDGREYRGEQFAAHI